MAAQLRQGSLAIEELTNGGTDLAGVTGRRGLDEWQHSSSRGHLPSKSQQMAAQIWQESLAVEASTNGGTALAGVTGHRGVDE